MRTALLFFFLLPIICCAEGSDLHPDFPVVEGDYRLTQEWAFNLGQAHNRRVEDGSLVFWRPGLTTWLNIWNNKNQQSIDERMRQIKAETASGAYGHASSDSGGARLFYYRVDEKGDESTVFALNGFLVSQQNQLQVSIYFDSEEEFQHAKALIESFTYTQP